MITALRTNFIGGGIKLNPKFFSRFVQWNILLIGSVLLASGCSGTPQRLQTHFEPEADASEVIQRKLAVHSDDRLPVGMVLVLDEDYSHVSLVGLEDGWPQFTARAKHAVQDLIPVTMQEVIRLDEIPAGEKAHLLQGLGETTKAELVLVVLPSSREARGPAQFDVLPEVSRLNGYQVDNYASVELGLLDLKSGKLLLVAQGTSFATLEQLDVPLASNRYPRVRGSAMTSPIFPSEDRALGTLRMVALNEALDQAVMKLSEKWKEGQKS